MNSDNIGERNDFAVDIGAENAGQLIGSSSSYSRKKITINDLISMLISI